jgi:hypothetical protein
VAPSRIRHRRGHGARCALGLAGERRRTHDLVDRAAGRADGGTSVVLTGAGFTGTTAVAFKGTAATFTVDSDIQITTLVPSGATTGPITVTNPDGTGTSSANFVGESALTITDMDPGRGQFRTQVALTGSGFTEVTDVEFNGVSADFTVVSDVEIITQVPSGAGTGRITATNASGSATSQSRFQFLLDQHRSVVHLDLVGHLVASGEVRIPDGTGICDNDRRISVQRYSSGHWRAVRRDSTGTSGGYRVTLPDTSGKYRVVVAREGLTNDSCGANVSRPDMYIKPSPPGGGDDEPSPNCTPGYSPCLAYHGGADYDCYGGSGDGPYYTAPGVVYSVTGSDPYGLDADNDGRGCE